MANNSLINEEQFNTSIQQLYAQKIFPYLNGATHTGCVPLGTVLPYYGETAPDHFLICDGTEYLKSDYGELATHLLSLTDPTPYQGSDANHFKVPDLRGEFLRGSGTNSHTDQGSGGAVGVHQDATVHARASSANAANLRITYETHDAYKQVWYENEDTFIAREGVIYVNGASSSADSTHDLYSGNFTSRPTNTSVTYIIAYQNAYIDLALDGFPIDITQPQDGQLLMYDATAGRWVNGGHKYSTDEHVVGTWIDGKPIYEKTINFGTLPNKTTKTVAHEITNLDSFIELKTVSKRSSDLRFYPIPFVAPDTLNIAVRIDSVGPNIRIQTEVDMSDFTQTFITVQYTKTTD